MKVIYSRESCHGSELDEDVFGDGSSGGGLLGRRKLVLGRPGTGLLFYLQKFFREYEFIYTKILNLPN